MNVKSWKSMTVDQVRAWLRPRMEKGETCPCCKQRVQIYRRSLNATMARWLIWLVRSHEIELANLKLTRNDPPPPEEIWISSRRSGASGGDYGKLALWDLATKGDNKDGLKGRGVGLWQPTNKGISFAHGQDEVPSHLFIYNGKVLRRSDSFISIIDACGGQAEYDDATKRPVSLGWQSA